MVNDLDYDFGFGPVPAHPHLKGGGWVANTANVSDDCYVGPYAQVYGKAQISGSVRIDNYARVYGDAKVMDSSCVYGNAIVYQDAIVAGKARVSGDARVRGRALVTDEARIFESAEVCDNAKVRNYSEVYGNARVRGNADIMENARIYHDCIATRQPMIITGTLPVPIIVTDHHITVGCVSLAPDIWKQHGKVIIRLMIDMSGEDTPRSVAEKWIECLAILADVHRCASLVEEIDNFDLRDELDKIIAGERSRSQK